MNPDDPDDPDDLDEPLIDLIAALDARLAAGRPVTGQPDPELPPEQLRLYRLARASLQRLERVWPRAAPAGDTTRKEDIPSIDLLTGRGRVGKFQIRRELRRVPHGVVLLATNTETGNEVALQLPRVDALVDSQRRERFLREAQFLLGLEHPGLVPVREVGAVGTVCYLASPYAGDRTLASWLETFWDPVPVRTAAALVAALARAVECLHEHQILHLDIQPSNVLLAPIPAQAIADPDLAVAGVPRLTEYGLVKLLDHLSLVSVRPGGPAPGPAEYLAPEQADSRADLLGRATDVYALGVALHELLAGQPPFCGRNRFDTLRKILTQKPPGLRQERGEVSRDLEAVCLKCLEKDPARRYSTARELAEDLHRYLDGQPTVARPTVWWRRMWDWARRRSALAKMHLLVVGASILPG